ncbi:MAG: hypothetical protein VX438_10285, partial [Planctomycetota bacterium]|nr:hypothetical protein [Planctomycetota bacterium]
MTNKPLIWIGFIGFGLGIAGICPVSAEHPNRVVWEGEKGPGKGKHIVFVAGDHEYRGEETCPALARSLAKHYGF